MAASLFLGGCAISTELPGFAPPSVGQVLAGDSACAPPDPQIDQTARRLHAITRNFQGYYVKRTMAELAVERDEMLRRLLTQIRTIEGCMPEGPPRRARIEGMLTLAGVVMNGHDPYEPGVAVHAYDRKLHPRPMPFAQRACSGHGFEGSALCLVAGFPGAIADIVTFPLGTWIWAAEDDSSYVGLAEFPPAVALRAEVARARALQSR